jgi:hypothetical protein
MIEQLSSQQTGFIGRQIERNDVNVSLELYNVLELHLRAMLAVESSGTCQQALDFQSWGEQEVRRAGSPTASSLVIVSISLHRD